MNSVANRAFQALSLRQYQFANEPDLFPKIALVTPKERQYILRMLIKNHLGEILIPDFLEWTRPIVNFALEQQEKDDINHFFVYLTVRSGIVTSCTDDVWHVDGFSTRITHIPEQNYIWSDCFPTEYVVKSFPFPKDFNPKLHNIHHYFQDRITEKDEIFTPESTQVIRIDPYIIHRRPQVPEGTQRTFIRVSFVPIQIVDDNNTQNPLIPLPKYNLNGLTFRNTLVRY